MRIFPRVIREQLVQESLLALMHGLLPPSSWGALDLLDILWTIDLMALLR